MRAANTTPELIRVRVYTTDYNGRKSQMTQIGYFTSEEEAAKAGWKYEIV